MYSEFSPCGDQRTILTGEEEQQESMDVEVLIPFSRLLGGPLQPTYSKFKFNRRDAPKRCHC